MQTAVATTVRTLRWRVKACFFASALNSCGLLLPEIQWAYYWVLLGAALVLNLALRWLVRRDIPPSRDEDDYATLAVSATRWLYVLGVFPAALMMFLAWTGHLHKQVMPFFLCGYMFLVLAYNVLDISLEKRIDEELREDR